METRRPIKCQIMDWCHAPKVNFVVHSQAPCPYYDIGRRSMESSIKGKFILLPKNFETHAPNRSLKSTLKMYFGGGYGGSAWPNWDTLHPLSKHWLLSYSVVSDPSPCQWAWESSGRWHKYLGPCYTDRRFRCNFRLLALEGAVLAIELNMGWVNGRFLFVSLSFSLSFFLSLCFQINNYVSKSLKVHFIEKLSTDLKIFCKEFNSISTCIFWSTHIYLAMGPLLSISWKFYWKDAERP